jgi:hypothetical protein
MHISSANSHARGMWHAYVYHIREAKRKDPEDKTTHAGVEINLNTFQGVCAKPVIPDPTDMLSESKKLREADELCVLVSAAFYLYMSFIDSLITYLIY